MLARPRPVVELMTLRNRPIDWRAPIVTAKTPPAASRTSQNGDRRAWRAPAGKSAIEVSLGAYMVARQSSSSACSSATRA